ncbi:GNAT family N-acetyltransferase [uncultured Roseovarius sp.]|uniref:GNAT family N-acetyltransferase n=1 Tax=uncultured Roseovarius sp. TaxID=293344 RepID=UPI00261B47B8|nr:GNAT family N-acetyltransferase [uncultured Roseovarius sp.]
MTDFEIRAPRPLELDALSALNMRSKAHWGYDSEFIAACKDELTVTPQDVISTRLAAIKLDGQLVGMAQVAREGDDANLLKLFVDPPFIGTGAGRCLFDWCVLSARSMSATRLLIEADPQAASFYQHMGARLIGTAPSGSLPGRTLPLLEFALR